MWGGRNLQLKHTCQKNPEATFRNTKLFPWRACSLHISRASGELGWLVVATEVAAESPVATPWVGAEPWPLGPVVGSPHAGAGGPQLGPHLWAHFRHLVQPPWSGPWDRWLSMPLSDD